jgi:hypothetical protein
VNDDSALHTFTYHMDAREFEVTIPGGGSTKMLVKIDEPQTIHFWCAPHSGGAGDMEDDSMWGTLVVA